MAVKAFYTATDVSKLLGVGRSTFDWGLRHGKCPYGRKEGRIWVFTGEEVGEILKAKVKPGRP